MSLSLRRNPTVRVVGLLLIIGFFELHSHATAQQVGEQVYAKVAESVFLLEIVDTNGASVGTASGFLVSPDELITNAHVVRGGTINVVVGSLRVACSTEKTDIVNDLALCKMSARSGAAPLTFASGELKPGSVVFVISNPRGLERTISQGLLTGYREVQGQKVIQVSAPISPGSSGGPILNSVGELVGVAVASLTSGQNLNFAVPASIVRQFIDNEPSHTITSSSFLETARRLQAQQADIAYSDQAGSPWQVLNSQIRDALTQAITLTTDPKVLTEAYAVAGFPLSDIQVEAARKALKVSKLPSNEMLSSLARALYYSTDSTGPSPALEEAEKAALGATTLNTNDVDGWLLLGDIQQQAERWQQAYVTYSKAGTLAKPKTPQATMAHYSLFVVSRKLGRAVDAEGWFVKAKSGRLAGYQWAFYASFLESLSRYSEAGDAFLEAAGLVRNNFKYICDAGYDYYLGGKYDEALTYSRRCIELASTATKTEGDLRYAHVAIADILNQRGVYDQATLHARKAITLSPIDPWAHHRLAEALNGQRRFSEAMAAARNAIRLADGKVGAMHMELGHSHFELKQWPEAAQAYEKAAQLSPTSPAAAYNVAASLYNDRYYSQALTWYREVLSRDPNYKRKEEVLRKIDEILKR